jgi:hypothetical protein
MYQYLWYLSPVTDLCARKYEETQVQRFRIM